MLKGPLVTAVVASLAMAGVVGAFVCNASPYVTIAQAKKAGGDALHLAGVLVKDAPCGKSFATGHLEFTLRDEDGATIKVEHVGVQPASLMEADKLVAVGAMKGDRFVSSEILTKCPSKYEEGKPRNPLARKA